MIRDITIGQYLPGDSMLHRADPRVKIFLTLSYMVTLFFVSNFMGFLAYVIFTLVVIRGSQIPIRYSLKGLKPILIIIIITALVNIFTIPGTPIFEVSFIHITYEGIETAVVMALRLTLLIMGASLLTYTTTPILLTDAIEKILWPLKKLGIPVHEIAMMMTIAIRFIPTLLEETDKIIKAQSSRGAEFDTRNLLNRAKSFIPVLIPLFVSAFRRADELATAMEARCYRGDVGRTRMKQLQITRVDGVITVILSLFILIIIVLHNISFLQLLVHS